MRYSRCLFVIGNCWVSLFYVYAKSEQLDISAHIQFDQAMYHETASSYIDAENPFINGANLRKASLALERKLEGEKELHVEFNMVSGGIGTAYFKRPTISRKHFLLIGQVPPAFGLEASLSGKWIPFLEKSLAISAFTPSIGPGMQWHQWGERYSLKFAVTQPTYGKKSSAPYQRSDPWSGSSRLTYTPLDHPSHFVHLGLSGAYRELAEPLHLSAQELYARYNPQLILSVDESGNPLNGKNLSLVSFEAGWQYASVNIEADVIHCQIARENETNVLWQGGHVQINYFWHGRYRTYNHTDGTFGKPSQMENTWQIAARVSAIDMNDKHTRGGQQVNSSLALSHYPRKDIRLIANWIYATIDPMQDTKRRQLNQLGLRLQYLW